MNVIDQHYPYELMLEQRHALEHLQADFQWGGYGIRVIRFHHTTFPPGKIDLFHKHSEEYEFHYIPRGSGKVVIEQQSFSLKEGLMYLTAPNVLHYQEASPTEAMDELCLRIQIIPLGLAPPTDSAWGISYEWREADECIQALNMIPKRPIYDQYRAMEPFLTAYRAWYEGQAGLMTTIRQSIIQILLRTVRAYFPKAQPELPMKNMHQYRYQLAKQYIKDNYEKPLSIDDVANHLHISPRQLQRIFKTASSTTFTEYVEQTRMYHICYDLEHTTHTIESIASRHGFSNINYFYRIFKRSYGMTPISYRLFKQSIHTK